MNKRQFLLAAVLATSALTTAALPATAFAQDETPLVSKAKIIDALSAKDIVLDQPGRPGRHGAGRRHAAIDLYVQFTFDSAELMPAGKRQLDELAMALADKSLANAAFMLAGHTDQVGDADYNVKLSLSRAQAVKAYLAEAHGIPEARLSTIGYGFSRLLDAAHPKAAVNRRVEVRRLPAGGANAVPGTVQPSRLVPTP